MITLALSSSTALVGVALARDGVLLAERSVLTDRRHAEEITPMVAEIMATAGVAISTIDRIVLDVGPGRYTGMRVGITTAKTLAFAIDAPIVPVTSLYLLGEAARPIVHRGPRFAVIDARRNQVFAQNIDDNTSPPLVVSPAELIEALGADALLVGDGADRYEDQFASVAKVKVGVTPSVSAGALIDRNVASAPTAQIEPLYLREPDAAINIKTRPGGAKEAT